jgi:TolA-binding protein
LARHRAGDRAGAASAFGALAASPEARALATTCRYLEARTLAEGGEPARAAEALILLLRGDREVLWEPEILEQLGSCERALNRPLRARRYWDEVLERFPEDRVVGARIRARLAESRSAPEGDR